MEGAASTETEKSVWNLTMNKGDDCVDRNDGEEGREKSTESYKFLIRYMEERDNVWKVGCWEALGLWSG